MSHLLGEAGRAFLKAFLASLLVVAIGVSQQANLNDAIAIGIAGLMASFGAGLAAIQAFVPELTFRSLIPGLPGAMLDSFVHAALGSFIVAVIGIFQEPDYSTWHSLIIAAVVGAINAGLRAIQGSLTPGEDPSPQRGIRARAAVVRDGEAHPRPLAIAPA